MEIVYLLVPLAIVVVAIAIAGFFWAIRSGQFDDLEGPAHRILMDDTPGSNPKNTDKDHDTPPRRAEAPPFH